MSWFRAGGSAPSATPNQGANRWSTWRARARLFGLWLGIAGAIFTLLWHTQPFYPIWRWLFWHYAQFWPLSLSFCLACLGGGFALVRLVAPAQWPLSERLYLSLPAGIFLYFTAMFLGGLVHLYGIAFAILLPILLFLPGAWPLYRALKRSRRHLASARRRRAPPSLLHTIVAALGLIALLLVYVNILT